MNKLDSLSGKKILITGGLGFIGSNLARKCLELGAEVTIFDAVMENTGANFFNIEDFKDKVIFIKGDIRNKEEISEAVKNKDYLFSCAAQVSHGLSMENPFLDADINCKGHITILEACRLNNPDIKIIFTGTRTQVGSISGASMNENCQQNPTDIYGANMMASEIYHMIYHKVYGLHTVSVRLPNIYGPGAQIKNPKYGVINFFVGKAITNNSITIFEPGTQLRDILYIDDVVNALILVAQKSESTGNVFMIGSGKGIALKEIAEEIVRHAKSGNVQLIPWPSEKKGVEAGDVIIDYSKIKNLLGWSPETSLKEGMAKTIDFYKQNIHHYLT